MRLPRRPQLPARTARAVLVAAVTATAVLVPSVAWAADGNGTTDPAAGVASLTTGAPDLLGDQSGTGGSGDQTTGTSTATETTTSSPPAAASSSPPDPIDLSQLDALLAQAGISPACSTSVEADIQQALADIPATAEQLLQEILDQLGSGLPTSPLVLTDQVTKKPVTMSAAKVDGTTVPQLTSPDPSELLLVQDIQQLITDLLTKCIPAPPTLPSPPSSQPPAAGPPAAQPVTYLGYAPTGGTGPAAPEGDGSAPLAGLGAGLLLTGCAGVVWYRVRSRAARAQD